MIPVALISGLSVAGSIGSIASYFENRSRNQSAQEADAQDKSGQAGKLFSALDTNQDGVVDAEELAAALGGSDSAKSSASALVSALDTDDSGGITSSELEDAIATLKSQLEASFGKLPDAPPASEELFAQTDTDGDGSIEETELASALAQGGESGSASAASELFAALDANGDGKITLQEHTDGLAALTATAAGAANDKSMQATTALIALLLSRYHAGESDAAAGTTGANQIDTSA